MKHDYLPVYLIQTFVVFVEATNITEAAGRLDISQPAVSVHLRKLEELLPQPIFKKVGKRKELSDYGKSLYQKLAPTFHKLQSHSLDVQNLGEKKQKKVYRIGGARGCFTLAAKNLKLDGILDFQEKEEEQLVKGLLSHDIDFAVTSTLPPEGNYRVQKIYEGSHFLYIHQDLISERTSTNNFLWLNEVPFVFTKEEEDFFLSQLKSFSLEKEGINIQHIVPYFSDAIQIVENIPSATFIPSHYEQICQSPHCKIIRNEGSAMPTSLYLISL